MHFKIAIFFLISVVLYAEPGYHLPWGKDAVLCVPAKKVHSSSPESLVATLAKQAIRFHQKVLSPVDGPRSHFYPCSSQYMKLAITKHGFCRGFCMGCDRLIREGKDPWIYKKIVIGRQLIKYDPPR
ncbi:MAG: membrane protein insertion efficiency factor YidD [Chlamydiae bacterium]|nr:membrane protein insertion efficiency factor YidD [Chlamydiota bacterium]